MVIRDGDLVVLRDSDGGNGNCMRSRRGEGFMLIEVHEHAYDEASNGGGECSCIQTRWIAEETIRAVHYTPNGGIVETDNGDVYHIDDEEHARLRGQTVVRAEPRFFALNWWRNRKTINCVSYPILAWCDPASPDSIPISRIANRGTDSSGWVILRPDGRVIGPGLREWSTLEDWMTEQSRTKAEAKK